MRFAVLAAALILAPLLAAAPAPAHEFHRLGDIVIEQPWSRATPVKVGGAYMTLRNNGAIPDKLIKITSPVAERVEIHETKIEGGMAMMRPVAAIELKRRSSVQLKPGGLHVMLMGLKGPLEEGQSFALTLEFEHAGTVEVMATIEDIAHGGPGGHNH
jgi:copper(I)-binding protein